MQERHVRGMVLLAVMICVALQSSPRRLLADTKPAAPPMTLKVGDSAPDFTLKYFNGEKLSDISLKDYRGKKNVLVAFYVFAFTGG